MLWRNRTWVKPAVKWLLVMLVASLAAATSVAWAQPAKSASGQYVVCETLAVDVSLMARAMKLGLLTTSWDSGDNADWYTRTVVAHARKAITTSNPARYVRELDKACLLEGA